MKGRIFQLINGVGVHLEVAITAAKEARVGIQESESFLVRDAGILTPAVAPLHPAIVRRLMASSAMNAALLMLSPMNAQANRAAK